MKQGEDSLLAQAPTGRVRKTDVWRAEWWKSGWSPHILWVGAGGLVYFMHFLVFPVFWAASMVLRGYADDFRMQASWNFDALVIGEHRWLWKDIDELGVVGKGPQIRIVANGQATLVAGPALEERRDTLLAHWAAHLNEAGAVDRPAIPAVWTERFEGGEGACKLARRPTEAWLRDAGAATALGSFFMWIFLMMYKVLPENLFFYSGLPILGGVLFLMALAAGLLANGVRRWRRQGKIAIDLHQLQITEPTGEVWKASWDQITDLTYDDLTITVTTAEEVVVWYADRHPPVWVRGLGHDLQQRWKHGNEGRQDIADSEAERRRLGALRASRE